MLFNLEHVAIWDFIYEHVSYFSPASLSYLLASSGFLELVCTATYGNQFLQIEGRLADHPPERTKLPHQILSSVPSFVAGYEFNLGKWKERLRLLSKTDQRVVVWGTGSKANTFLNVLSSQSPIEYSVDINPRKHGMFVPGTGQEIVSPKMLQGYQPDAVIIMNPLYEKEIRGELNIMGLHPQVLLA